MRNFVTVASWGVIGGLILAALPARAEIIDGVAAVVNGEVVMLSEVEEHAGAGLPPRDATGEAKTHREAQLKRAADDLVTEKLVAKECKEQSLEPTPLEIDNAIEDVQRSNHIDKPTLERALKEQGLTMLRYRDMLTEQLCRMKVVEMKVKNRVTVTEDDVKHAIVQKSATVAPALELKVRDIYLPSETNPDVVRATILEAHNRLKKGDDFTLVATETGGPLAKTGGDLGWMKLEELAPELQKIAAELPKDGVSNIIQTKLGYHILKVEDRRTSSEPRVQAEAREELRQQLLQSKLAKATEDYLADLRRSAEIEYRLQ